MSQEFELDHTITAPLGVMFPQMDIPLVAAVDQHIDAPDPLGARAAARSERRSAGAVERSPLERRVVVVASGAFSFEVGGPRISEDSHVGVPAPEWALRVTGAARSRRTWTQLVNETTPEQLAAAGNAGGEILNWIAMLGTFDARPRRRSSRRNPRRATRSRAWTV